MQCRADQRYQIEMPCRVRADAGLALPARVTDMNTTGCALTAVRTRLRRKDRVSVLLGDLGTVAAEVCWIGNDRTAGLRFVRPIPSGAVESMMRNAVRAAVLAEPSQPVPAVAPSNLRPVC